MATLNVFSDDPNLGPNLMTPITGLAGDPKISTDIGTGVFGNVRVGLTSMPQTINIMNTGNSDLKISMVVIDAGPMGNGHPVDFVLDRAMVPNNTVIPAMGMKPIAVTFKPTMTGNRTARVVIVSDDPNTPAKYITLIGTGTFAMLSAAPGNIDFGMQTIYLASAITSVTFTNAGTDAASITKVTFGGMNPTWFRTNGIVVFPLKVAAGGTAKIDLIALPLGLSTGTATVTFETDDAMTPKFDIPLKVVGIGASVKLTPPYGDFGTVGLMARVTRDFELCNVGSGDLALKDFRFIDTKQCTCFQVNNAPMPDMMGEWPKLKPNECLKFSVVFAPQTEGAFTAQIEIDTDDPMARHIHLPLDGQGAQASLKVEPTTLNFMQVIVGNVSVPQTVKISNQGGSDLTISKVALAGMHPNNFQFDDSQFKDAMGNPKKVTLAPTQELVVPVTYQPVGMGSHSASLVVTPDMFSPVTVKLVGSAVQPIIQLATGQTPPNVADFDQVGVVVLNTRLQSVPDRHPRSAGRAGGAARRDPVEQPGRVPRRQLDDQDGPRTGRHDDVQPDLPPDQRDARDSDGDGGHPRHLRGAGLDHRQGHGDAFHPAAPA
jgi:hypothetical protein